MRWLDGITDSMDMSLSQPLELVMVWLAEGSSVSELLLASWGVGPGCLAAGPWGPGVGVGLLISGDSSSHSWSYRILSLPKLMGGLGSQGGWLRGPGCPGSGAGLWRLD